MLHLQLLIQVKLSLVNRIGLAINKNPVANDWVLFCINMYLFD